MVQIWKMQHFKIEQLEMRYGFSVLPRSILLAQFGFQNHDLTVAIISLNDRFGIVVAVL
jgi:hypothetical protein